MTSIPPHIEAYSTPEYPRRHSGTLLVVGTAWCMFEDVDAAQHMRPGAKVMGIRLTGTLMACDFLFTVDRESLQGVRAKHAANFGIEGVEVHSIIPPGGKTPADYPWIDYFWKRPAGTGTSAWAGAIIGRFMGFEEIILCGAPLERGPYATGKNADTFESRTNLANMRSCIVRDEWMHDCVRSMSGFTKDFLGYPE